MSASPCTQEKGKAAKRGNKEAQAELALCDKLIPHFDQGKPAITLDCTEEEAKLLIPAHASGHLYAALSRFCSKSRRTRWSEATTS